MKFWGISLNFSHNFLFKGLLSWNMIFPPMARDQHLGQAWKMSELIINSVLRPFVLLGFALDLEKYFSKSWKSQ